MALVGARLHPQRLSPCLWPPLRLRVRVVKLKANLSCQGVHRRLGALLSSSSRHILSVLRVWSWTQHKLQRALLSSLCQSPRVSLRLHLNLNLNPRLRLTSSLSLNLSSWVLCHHILRVLHHLNPSPRVPVPAAGPLLCIQRAPATTTKVY